MPTWVALQSSVDLTSLKYLGLNAGLKPFCGIYMAPHCATGLFVFLLYRYLLRTGQKSKDSFHHVKFINMLK